ncbi:DUF1642 domain-containing protein [Streptococcus mitis]|uniref:Phage protein n=1 Tax=Streptococcus mitis TaxID=28037 RepID=A0A1X1K5W3_STRMT|nr:DUF1642 domain-containing protein [Streptococcus mitis]ORO94745.1 hypothetical protein B7698_05735 [Streptococcus mitis]
MNNNKELVTIPEEVGNFITRQKEQGNNFFTSLENLKFKIEILMWITKDDNEDKFLSAWVNGFELEAEKTYKIRMKNMKNGYDYLNYDKSNFQWFLMDKHEVGDFRTAHTRKELEEAGFGLMLSSALFEVEEA